MTKLEALAVKNGHRKTIQWMASEQFSELKQLYDRVFGDGGVYFRPTDIGVVVIVLDEDAKGYVGFRTDKYDLGYILKVGSLVPIEDELQQRHNAFKKWLSKVERSSKEESAVIPWIRAALTNKLLLPDIEGEWLFLNQEWRFNGMGGKGKKSDVLAVQVSTGRLGIIEVKSNSTKESFAVKQLQEYFSYWQRDKQELRPFFTNTLRMMGKLYGNQWAMGAEVSKDPATLFFACPSEGGLCIKKIEKASEGSHQE